MVQILCFSFLFLCQKDSALAFIFTFLHSVVHIHCFKFISKSLSFLFLHIYCLQVFLSPAAKLSFKHRSDNIYPLLKILQWQPCNIQRQSVSVSIVLFYPLPFKNTSASLASFCRKLHMALAVSYTTSSITNLFLSSGSLSKTKICSNFSHFKKLILITHVDLAIE